PVTANTRSYSRNRGSTVKTARSRLTSIRRADRPAPWMKVKVKAEAPNPSGFLNPQDVQSLPPVRQDLASSLSGRHISLFTMGRLIHQSPHFFIWHLIWAKDYRMRLALNRNLRRPHLPGFTVKTLLARFTPR